MHPEDTTARIPLRARDGSIRAYALVDAADAEWANQWRWSLGKGYALRIGCAGGSRQTILLHRELLGLSPGDGLEGDHINRDRLDCRRANLRVVPKKGQPNHQNVSSHRGATSRHRGVSWDKRNGKWFVKVWAGGKHHYLGLFADEEEAAQVARDARLRLMPYAVD